MAFTWHNLQLLQLNFSGPYMIMGFPVKAQRNLPEVAKREFSIDYPKEDFFQSRTLPLAIDPKNCNTLKEK